MKVYRGTELIVDNDLDATDADVADVAADLAAEAVAREAADEVLQDNIDAVVLSSGVGSVAGLTGAVTAAGLKTALSYPTSAQPLDTDLTDISALSPFNDDIIQRKSGAWTRRTMAQLRTDLAFTPTDVGLANVDNTSDLGKPVSTATTAAIAAATTAERTAAATYTNKTLTSPTVNTPTVTNPTTSTGTFTSPALVSPAITGSPTLQTYALGTYTDYVPTITGVAATVTDARYMRIGQRCTGYVLFTLTGAPSGFVTCSLPVAAKAAYVRLAIGPCTIKASGIVNDCVVVIDGDASSVFIAQNDDFMKNGQGWVSSNVVGFSFDYEAA